MLKLFTKIFIPVIGSIASLVMLFLYMCLEKHKFVVNNYSLALFFSIFLFPATSYLEKIKIGSIELTRRQEIIEKRSISGEVVTTNYSTFYYIKNENGNLVRYDLPDKETAEFFCSAKGFVKVSADEINDIGFSDEKIESVKSGDIVEYKGHIFIILNKKFKHVGTATWLLKWNKPDIKKIKDDEENNYGYW